MFNQSGVIRARSLRDMLEFARGIPVLPTPKGENVVIITGAGGSGVLLSDACIDNKLSLMTIPPDLTRRSANYPAVRCGRQPIDITGASRRSPTSTRSSLASKIRAFMLILGYWHTIVTPPMVFARNIVEVKNREGQGHREADRGLACRRYRSRGAADYLYQNGIVAYAYSTEIRSRGPARNTNGPAAPGCCKH